MDLALLGARLLLSPVFLIAGFTKLFDRAGSRQAIIDFGGPARLAPILGLLLPLAECVVGFALLPLGSAWMAAVAGLALLLLFMAAIGINLARGKRPECRCFGRIHSTPVGLRTLARNGALLGIAAFVIAFGRQKAGFSLIAWTAGLTLPERMNLTFGALAISLAGATLWFIIQLAAQNGRFLLRIEALEKQNNISQAALEVPGPALATVPGNGLSPGTPAPHFELPSLSGELVDLTSLRAGRKGVVLLFSDPNCGPCNALLPDIHAWEHHLKDTALVIVSRGTLEANRAKGEEYKLPPVLLQKDDAVANLYKAYGTPSAVLVDSSGTINSYVAQGADQIRALIAQVKAGQPTVSAPPVQEQVRSAEPIVVQLIRQNAQILQRLDAMENLLRYGPQPAPAPRMPDGLPIGMEAPLFELPEINGGRRSLVEFRGRKVLLIFFNPNCGFCEKMAPDLAALSANESDAVVLPLLVTTGPVGDNRKFIKTHRIRCPVLRQEQSEVAGMYGTSGTPTGYLIDEEGKIESKLAVGGESLLSLASHVAELKSEREDHVAVNGTGHR